jgi:hypothetical protein
MKIFIRKKMGILFQNIFLVSIALSENGLLFREEKILDWSFRKFFSKDRSLFQKMDCSFRNFFVKGVTPSRKFFVSRFQELVKHEKTRTICNYTTEYRGIYRRLFSSRKCKTKEKLRTTIP